ncbi:hypothetical protein JX265_003091 [Neoarthrinium moseri]|uniref:Uncharacterized protein n=1 Tax=Neoarthrinium moseri TaxID=1658444 RepID=A0A9P9WTM4_9PEZI|nr:hypothetical protein JX265_003091 [Neoarthrinium moseri]
MCLLPAPDLFFTHSTLSHQRPTASKSDSLTDVFYSRGPLNGSGYKVASEDDTADEGGLSPPPSSSVSSVNPDVLNDEIVVGTRQATATNGDKSSPLRVTSPKEDVEMAGVDDDAPISHYPKRKRASMYEHLGEDKLEGSLLPGAEDADANSRQTPKPRPGANQAKGVLLGYWRDSPVPKEAGKHAVIGFPDVRDRLRTRIQNYNRNGEAINTRLFPIPPGPGGSWVTFERVVFADHLVGLDHNEVKEYVKLRLVALKDENEFTSDEDRHKAELAAAQEAKRYLQEHPPPETAQPPAIAYGRDIPENPQHGYRPDAKRRRTGSATGTIGSNAQPHVPSQTSTPTPTPQPQPLPSQQQPEMMQDHRPAFQDAQHPPPAPAAAIMQQQQPPVQPAQPIMQQQPVDPMYVGNLPGQRPTRILVGCWSRSSAPNDSEKHAVYGILGANDMFRVKLVRETMDGRFVDGNFPTGAGALWIAYEEVNFLPHIRDLNRGEMKEYVRVRQYQIDSGEREDERVANETKAVYEAQRRAALNPKATPGPPQQAARHNLNSHGGDESMQSPKPEPGVQDMRQGRREMIPDIRGPRALSEAEYRQASRHGSVDPLERTNSLARREVHKMEAAQMRQDRHNPQRQGMNSAPMPAPGPVPSDSRVMFQDNIGRLNKVWTAQEAHRLQGQQQQQQQMMQMPPQPQPQQPQAQAMIPGPNMDEVRTVDNRTYTRKQNGPFAGKLVSRGEIITIDGEDYVEYRVLTKPSFF